jgi:aspartate aminotransferase
MLTEVKKANLKVSRMAENLIGSEIIKLAGQINEKIKKGEKIYNYTIGDFSPKVFPIPAELQQEIVDAYKAGQTNYPPANGIPELRQAVANFIREREGLSYSENEILVSGGARPLIYAIYQTLIDAGDRVIFPVPSWNNNHYCHLSGAKVDCIETSPENNFMPAAEEIRSRIHGATLLSLCSPLNPTGTTFTRKGLEEICDLVLEENSRRGPGEKPLYLLYDQIYWVLTYGKTEHFNPVSLRPEMRDYTIFVDGMSKAFAATGIRVGWAFGPGKVMDKMKDILSHIGAWAPKAEQVASAKYLVQQDNVNRFLTSFKKQVQERLDGFYNMLITLRQEGFNVNAIAPQAAIYLTVQFDLKGKKTASGKVLASTRDITAYLLEEAQLAIVPFHAFGASEESTWYRLSVGTCTLQEITDLTQKIREALGKLK